MFDDDLKVCICKEDTYNKENKTFETAATIEHICAKKIFNSKLEEVEKLTQQIKDDYLKKISVEKNKNTKKNKIDRLNHFSSSCEKFIKFIKVYGKQQGYYFLRTSSYHFYGSMVDLLEIRLKHLKNLE